MKRFTVIFVLLLGLVVVITVQNNKSMKKENEGIKYNYEFNISENFFNDLDKEIEKMNKGSLENDIKYYRLNNPFKIGEFEIFCSIKNQTDENGNIKSYLKLPSWVIRYTDIEDKPILLSQQYNDNDVIALNLININITENKWEIGSYIMQRKKNNYSDRLNFMNLYIKQENK